MAFNKFKQLKDLRSKAKEVQGQLADVSATEEYKGWTFTMNGSLELINVVVDPDTLSKGDAGYVEDIVKKGVNKTLKSVQKISAKKMMKEGGLDAFGLGG